MEENKGDKKGLIFTLFCITGFLLILVFVPRLVHSFGVSHGKDWSNGIGLIFVAIFWYFWGELCLYIKKRFGIE